jgi:transcriptional regulator with XRE-family HTH domain
MHTLGAVVRSSRREKGMTLRALASATDVSATFIDQIERNERTPSGATIARLAAALELSIDQLLLLAGRVPSDVLRCLQSAPDLLTRIRTGCV